MKEVDDKKKYKKGKRSKSELDDLQKAVERGESLFPHTEEVSFDNEGMEIFVEQAKQEDGKVKKSKVKKTLRRYSVRMGKLEAELAKQSMEIKKLQKEIAELRQELDDAKKLPSDPAPTAEVSAIGFSATRPSEIDEKMAELAKKHGIT